MIYPCGKMRVNSMMMVLSLQCFIITEMFAFQRPNFNELQRILMWFSMQFDNIRVACARALMCGFHTRDHCLPLISEFTINCSDIFQVIEHKCHSYLFWFWIPDAQSFDVHFQIRKLQMCNYPWNEVCSLTQEFNFEMNQKFIEDIPMEMYAVML